MFEDKGVANKLARAFLELPDDVPAVVVSGLQTKHFLRLDHVKHTEGVDAYLEEVDKITGRLRRIVK
jgi:hypothetical protein